MDKDTASLMARTTNADKVYVNVYIYIYIFMYTCLELGFFFARNVNVKVLTMDKVDHQPFDP